MIPNAINGLGKSGPKCAASQLAGLAFAPATFAVAAAIGLVVCGGARDGPAESHGVVGEGLLQVRRRRAERSYQKSEAKSGVKVELSQYAIQDMIPKTVAALIGNAADVAYSDSYDVQAAGKWAFEGKLEDLTDILTPMKSRVRGQYGRDRDSTTTRPRRRPITASRSSSRACMCRSGSDMLEQAGFKQSDIPTKWEDYWFALVRQGAAGLPQGHRQRASMASGSRWASNRPTCFSRSTHSWTPTTSSWSTTTASCWSMIPRFDRA